MPTESDREPLQPSQPRRFVGLLNLLALGQIVFFICTQSLWVPPVRFPQIPLCSVALDWPVGVEIVAYLASLAGICGAWRAEVTPLRRLRHAVCALGFAVLFVGNQHRLQVWAYQFFILHMWLALANPRWMMPGWRWLVISIYVYSAASKFDYTFGMQQGPFLWDGFWQAWGWPHGTAHWPKRLLLAAAWAMPVTEMTAAILLCIRRTQRLGLVLSLLMHGFLLVALGPWGHNHSAGVLLWNCFFIIQNLLLFSGSRGETVVHQEARFQSMWPKNPRETCGLCVLGFAMIAPLGESFGLWDIWPSWAVYAARPAKTSIFIHEDDVSRIPDGLQKYLQPPSPLEPWQKLRIDHWSLDAVGTPIYPQDRFHIGIALALVEECQLNSVRVVIEGPPHRWTGIRSKQEYTGVESVRKLADSFRCNARPRKSPSKALYL